MNYDHITFTGTNHLAEHGKEIAICGKTAKFWYRIPWSGKRDGICKNCLKKLEPKAKK
jgi:hypothetical protein